MKKTDAPVDSLPIDAIRVGTRHRQYLGDIDALAASIADVGLLHPIVVTPERTLIAGERRLLAVRQLGWPQVPVTVVPLREIVRGELAENVVRLGFTPSEQAAIAAAVRPLEEAAARERMSEGGKGRKVALPSQARDRLAAYVGTSGRTLDKIVEVVDAAAIDPEMGDLVAEMDRTGKVDAAHRELKRRVNRQLVEATPTVAAHSDGQRYRAIVLDPPWDFSDEGDADQMGRSRPTYSTMPIADVAALPVGDLADLSGCHLYLWITNRSLPKGFALLEAWGFRYVTVLTWCKPSIGVGNYFRNSTEHVLFGVRGSLPLLYQDTGTWFEADRPGRHSAKPEQFYQMVCRLSPGPRLEMFARGERDGFATWGAEAA